MRECPGWESAGSITRGSEKRDQDVADGCRNAMHPAAAGDDTVADVPFEWPAGFAITQDGCTHVGRKGPELVEDRLRYIVAKPGALGPGDGQALPQVVQREPGDVGPAEHARAAMGQRHEPGCRILKPLAPDRKKH